MWPKERLENTTRTRKHDHRMTVKVFFFELVEHWSKTFICNVLIIVLVRVYTSLPLYIWLKTFDLVGDKYATAHGKTGATLHHGFGTTFHLESCANARANARLVQIPHYLQHCSKTRNLGGELESQTERPANKYLFTEIYIGAKDIKMHETECVIVS